MTAAIRGGRAWLIAGVATAAAAALALLLLRPSEPALLADPENAPQVARGAALYARHCASCHGARLEGEADWRRRRPDGRLPAPPHDSTGHTWHHPDRQIFAVTKHGSAATMPAGFIAGMPGFADRLRDDEIWSIIAFIKSRWPAAIRKRQPKAADTGR